MDEKKERRDNNKKPKSNDHHIRAYQTCSHLSKHHVKFRVIIRSFGIIDGLRTWHPPARVDEVEDSNGQNHHGAVERDEVPLRGDEVSVPTLQQLDRPVDAADIDTDDGENHGPQEGDHGVPHRVQHVASHRAPDEVGSTHHKDGDGRHLEDDTRDHDVRACRGVAVDLVRLGGGYAPSDGLDHEGEDIAGTKDPQVEGGTEK